MLKILKIRMNYAKEKLNNLIEQYGLMDKKVLRQSHKLDKLIIKYCRIRNTSKIKTYMINCLFL